MWGEGERAISSVDSNRLRFRRVCRDPWEIPMYLSACAVSIAHDQCERRRHALLQHLTICAHVYSDVIPAYHLPWTLWPSLWRIYLQLRVPSICPQGESRDMDPVFDGINDILRIYMCVRRMILHCVRTSIYFTVRQTVCSVGKQ